MNIILWIVLGGIAGWIASLITNSDRGVLGDIILGILGAIIGGWVVTLIGGQGVTGFNLSSLLVAVLGAVILIWISRAFRGGTARNI
jgi:uncharacterized membrane protein YeaQ/YmgE (transglycosylase-associated protein family)